tara:strand:- start:1072 stop:1341 length:270 start_codon:yes stop_codon:yes gene_type:complete
VHEPRRSSGGRAIRVDELSYRKHRRYVTLVTDQVGRRIVWGEEGQTRPLWPRSWGDGEEGWKQIQLVSMDLSTALKKAVDGQVPHASKV